jgi:hypothetical protein
VIAAGDHFDSAGKKVFSDTRRDAKTGGGVFAVGDAEVDFALRENVCEPVVNDLAARRAYDVANEKDFQTRTFPRKIRSLDSVRSLGTAMLVASKERSTRPCAARP